MKNIKGILDMKKLFISCVALIVVVAMMSRVAEAKPPFGADCASCHNANVGGALNVLPSSLISMVPGGAATITFDILSIPSGEAGIGLTGLDAAGLGATIGAGWTDFGAHVGTDEPFLSAPGTYSLDLTIDSGATFGDYPIGGQLAGDEGFTAESWASAFDFTVRLVPEPSTFVLLGLGLSGLGLVRWHRRRRRM